LPEISPYANIIGEFLPHNAHLGTIGAIKVSPQISSTAQQSFVTLDFPDFDASIVDCETPYGPDQ